MPTIPTKLSLFDWAQIIGINPLHFAGIDLRLDGVGGHCIQPWVEYPWQGGDKTSRDDVARAISMAEGMMEQYLGFHLMPAYDVRDRIKSTQFWVPEIFWPSSHFRTNWGYIIAPGRRVTTPLTIIPQQIDDLPAPAVDIAWSESGYWQIGTVLASVDADTDPCDVRVYFPGKGPDPVWEIRPAAVTVSGVVATITFKREQAVDPDLWDALQFQAADGEDDADFISSVDVFLETTDPSESVSFRREPYGLCNCNGAGCHACAIQTSSGCFFIHDDQVGNVVARPGTWTDGEFTVTSCPIGRPDAVDLSYLSGYRDERQLCPNKTMFREFAQAVAYFSAALLERPPCDCQVDSWMYWREDANRGDVRYSVQAVKDTPFGTRRGALYAWEKVLEYANGDAVVSR